MSIFLLWEMILTQYDNNLWAGFNSLGYILEGKWQSTSVFLPEKPHGQRSLAGHSPKGPRESDTTEQLMNHASRVHSLNRGLGGTLVSSEASQHLLT